MRCVIKIEDLKGAERTLVVIALQALYRERLTAYNAVCTVCDVAGKTAPDFKALGQEYGLDEVTDALRRIGAAPMK